MDDTGAPCQGLIHFLKTLVFPLVTFFKILLTVSLDDIIIDVVGRKSLIIVGHSGDLKSKELLPPLYLLLHTSFQNFKKLFLHQYLSQSQWTSIAKLKKLHKGFLSFFSLSGNCKSALHLKHSKVTLDNFSFSA